jgi:hypothetical protein
VATAQPDEQQQRIRAGGGGNDGNTTYTWYGRAMNLAVMIWLVYQAKTPREVPDKWRQEQRQCERNEAEKD